MGSPRTHRALIANLASGAGVRALSLDYRLAPENPYPAALDDCVAAYGWLLASGIEPGRIVVAGDSAGGNLALALLLRLRDAGSPLPGGAVLLSPATDLGLGGASHMTRKALDPVFAGADIRTFITAYVGAHDPQEPYLSPLGAGPPWPAAAAHPRRRPRDPPRRRRPARRACSRGGRRGANDRLARDDARLPEPRPVPPRGASGQSRDRGVRPVEGERSRVATNPRVWPKRTSRNPPAPARRFRA